MYKKKGYHSIPFTMNRRMVAASASVGRERNNIHAITEVDITEPRRLMKEHLEKTGEKLSLTAFVVTCLSRTVCENLQFNAFRKGGRLFILDDVTISVLVERQISGEQMPEPFGIRAAQLKTYRQIHDEIRAAQSHAKDGIGGLSGTEWIRFIPGFLLRSFIRIASRNIKMASKFGVVGVTAVGMFGSGALWFIPLGGATVVVTVGGIVSRPCTTGDAAGTREHLCLTVTFNHDIIDGAPAARFMKRFTELLMSPALLPC